MKNLTIIVPLVQYVEEKHSSLYDKSINSIVKADPNEDVNVIFIGPSSALDVVREYDLGKRDVLYIENAKNTEVQFQINKAVKDVTTEYFSVLEYDDNYTPNWFNNFEKYRLAYDDVSLFLPLMEVYDYKRPELGAVGYANEPVWASAFSDEIGFIDSECLKHYFNFFVSGGIFRKTDFINVGGIKNNIKVFFWYELLMRICHLGKRILVIPKVGYEHYVNVENSLSSTFGSMPNEEIDFWFKTSQEEYMYKTDRKVSYTTE